MVGHLMPLNTIPRSRLTHWSVAYASGYLDCPCSQSKRKAHSLYSVADSQPERYRGRGVRSVKYTQYHTFVQSAGWLCSHFASTTGQKSTQHSFPTDSYP